MAAKKPVPRADRGCEKCGCKDAHRSQMPLPTKELSEKLAVLCPECKQEWHDAFMKIVLRRLGYRPLVKCYQDWDA